MEQERQRIAFVSGAGSGIGRATAILFAEQGAAVGVVDLDGEAAEGTVRDISQRGGRALPFECDVADEEATRKAVAGLVEAFGGLDYAFNNAGVSGGAPGRDDWDTDLWHRALAVNLTGTWHCMKYQVEHMRAGGGGAIVNMGSIAGLVGVGGLSYTATKHGIVGLTRAAGARLSAEGIRVNAVCPGPVRTPMVERALANDPDQMKAMVAAQPIGRLAEPEEIAEVVVWLCSPAASYVTGQAVAADGGFTSV